MKVVLPPSLAGYVEELVQTSGYRGPDEVLVEAQSRRQGTDVIMTPEFERLLDKGLENLEQSQTTEALRRRI